MIYLRVKHYTLLLLASYNAEYTHRQFATVTYNYFIVSTLDSPLYNFNYGPTDQHYF